MYKYFFKRLIDILFSLLTLMIFAPLLLISILLIALESKGPVFFIQDRLGTNANVFKLYKLRSMTVDPNRDERQVYLNSPGLTRFGKFIRRFKIDELPQLLNVLKGDMSLIGPRPCLPSLLKKFDENAWFRIKVRPGLTGLAQVNGNVTIPWEKRWEFDRYYVENISLSLDIKILIKTIMVVILGENK